jgi:hypothetical protein
MRAILRLALLIAVVGLPGLSVADQQTQQSTVQQPQQPATTDEQAAMTPWAKDLPPGEACWGDSRENDADLNEGARISIEDILRVINPVQS